MSVVGMLVLWVKGRIVAGLYVGWRTASCIMCLCFFGKSTKMPKVDHLKKCTLAQKVHVIKETSIG